MLDSERDKLKEISEANKSHKPNKSKSTANTKWEIDGILYSIRDKSTESSEANKSHKPNKSKSTASTKAETYKTLDSARDESIEISEKNKSNKSNESKSTASTKFKQFLLGICGIIFIPMHFFCRGIVSLWRSIVIDILSKLLSNTIMLFISSYSPFIYRLNNFINTLILGIVKLVTYFCLLPIGVFKWLFDGVTSFINLVRTFNQKYVLVSDKRQDVYHKKEAVEPNVFSTAIWGYVSGVYTIHTKDELENNLNLELEDDLISQNQPYKSREYYLKKPRPMCDQNGWFGKSIWF